MGETVKSPFRIAAFATTTITYSEVPYSLDLKRIETEWTVSLAAVAGLLHNRRQR